MCECQTPPTGGVEEFVPAGIPHVHRCRWCFYGAKAVDGRYPVRQDRLVKIIIDDLSGTEIAAFLQEHVEEMRTITPIEAAYALDLDGLRQPGITFWSVLDEDRLVGCGALKRLDAGHAELKSMRTRP